MSIQTIHSSTESFLRTSTRASFTGIMRGEFLKIARQWWFLFLLLLAGFIFSFLLLSSSRGTEVDLRNTPVHFFYSMMESNLSAFRVLVGIVLIILTSYVVGRDYQYGTIRILLARGTGRIQLLLAKVALLALIALALLIIFPMLNVLLVCLYIFIQQGNLAALNSLTPALWTNIGIYLFTILVSMVATILLSVAMNALGRSLTFGLSASLAWFAVDNMGIIVMELLAQLTHSTFWSDATTYFLGPLLNRLPDMVLPKQARYGFDAIGPAPLAPTNGTHALWVIGTYILIFCLLAIIPTWKRDVKE